MYKRQQELVLDALQTLLDVATETHAAERLSDPGQISASLESEPAATATQLLALSH